MNFFARIGKYVVDFFALFGKIVLLALRVARYSPRIAKDRKLVIEQLAIMGANSLPLIVLVGVFTGAIAALEATLLFSKFNLIGIARPFLGASIATAVFTELTPVLTALVIAGRIGGAMAAHLGAMKVSEQIDALEIMAIDKNRFLAMPRVIAALGAMPILAVFSNCVAILGALFLVQIKFGFSATEFFASIATYFSNKEIILSLVKSTVFGVATALIACQIGFDTAEGAEGVGNSAVKAFTLSAASILIIDAIFGIAI